MGANTSCPSGYEQVGLFECRAACPPEFKFIQEGGGSTGPPAFKCTSVRRNNRSFTVKILRPQKDGIPSAEYIAETERIKAERVRVLAEVDADLEEERLLQSAGDARSKQVSDYSKIQSDYAAYSERRSLVEEIEKTKQSLRPMRPPTSPASDMEKERKEITEIATRNLYFIQVALFLVVLALLSYVMFPLDTANLIAFALVSVGIAMGFFLKG